MNTTLLILMILCLLLAGFFLKAEHEQKYVLAVILKGLASLMFVIMGYLAYTRVNNIFNKIFCYGLIFGLIGDILLNLRFVFAKQGQKIFLVGILFFLIGHLFYLYGLLKQARHVWVWYCIIAGALAAALLLRYIFRTMEIKKAFKIFGIFYLGAVFIMCALAIGMAIFMPGKRRLVYCIGAILFTASDVILIFNTFSGTTKYSLRKANIFLYYLGQLLIAYSLFL